MFEVEVGEDGLARCWWGLSDPDYVAYHDREWGRPVADDRTLFEKVSLEGFQSGLSWLTILRKRDNFRAAFADFEPEAVAAFTDADVERLLDDAGIVRHRGKIESTINNATRLLEVQDELGSFATLVWSYEPVASDPVLEATTPESTALAKELKRRGFSFVGPTTVYAFMQAMGLVNDHLEGCFAREEVAKDRDGFNRPVADR
jgi:DNA-3-methyladenine glycosylase I